MPADIRRSIGAKVQLAERIRYEDAMGGRHFLIFEDNSPISLRREVMLVQTDVLLPDEPFKEFLLAKAPFDAVTIWLIGTYMARESCINLDILKIEQPADYRLHVQNAAYSLASGVLRKGGVLQVVDRGINPTTKDLYDNLLNSHRAQAVGTGLDVQEATFFPYKEQVTGRGVNMVANSKSSATINKERDLVLISIISKKPL